MADPFELSFGVTSGLTSLSVPFVIPDAALLERVRRHLPAALDVPFRYVTGPDPNLDFGLRQPDEPRGPGLYELFVPAGASRWATFRGLMHRAEVAKLTGTGNESLYFNGGIPSLHSGTLRLRADGGATTITRVMYLLPPYPLFGVNGAADLYLVTLVDSRYFAQFSSIGSAGSGLTSWVLTKAWADMIDNSVLADTGGLPTHYGTWPPESVYGQAELDSDFYAFAGPPGPFADASLAATGRVLCAGPDPGYTVLKWADANTFAAAARLANAADRVGGGALFTGYSDLALVAHLPGLIDVQFPIWVEGFGYRNCGNLGGGHSDDEDPRTHSSDGEYGLSIGFPVNPATDLAPPYSTMPADRTTLGITLNLRTTAKAYFDPGGTQDPANVTACTNLARQMAMDFYDAQIQAVTETYRGLVPFDPRAALDVTYCYGPEPLTRVSRPPLNCYPTRFGHGFGDTSAPQRVQVCKVTGGISSGYYPAVIAPGGTSTGFTVYLFPTNGEVLAVGSNYPAIRSELGHNGTPPRPVYCTAEGATGLVPGTTLVSGGTVNGVLYSNGTVLQSSANLLLAGAGTMPFIQAASGKWISMAIGSH